MLVTIGIYVGIVLGAAFIGWWYWYWLVYKLRPEVQERDRRRERDAYNERMSNPKYRKKFEK